MRFELPGADRFPIDERRADTDCHGAGANPLAGVVSSDAARGHQAHVRQRTADVLEERRAQRGRRKHLHDVSACIDSREDLRGSETPGHHGDVVTPARVDHADTEHGTHDESRSGSDHRFGGGLVEDRSCADNRLVGQLPHGLLDERHGVWHRHRDLDRAPGRGSASATRCPSRASASRTTATTPVASMACSTSARERREAVIAGTR